MNKIWMGVAALLLVANLTGCGIFRKGSKKTSSKSSVVDSTMTVNGDTVTIINANPVVINSTGDTVTKKVADSLVARITDSAKTRVDSAVVEAPGAASGTSAVVTGLLPAFNNHISYNTFSTKAKVHYESPKDNNDFTASIRMEKDKKIWVSITGLLGIEGARALITPDTIILIDRMHKEVTIVPFKDAGKLLPVSVEFGTLQSLLIGDAIHASADMPTEATTTNDLITLLLNTSSYQQQITFNKADSTLKQQQMKVGAAGVAGPLLVMNYNDYSAVDNRKFSANRNINITDTAGITKIDLEFDKIEFDQQLDFSFSIPSRYKVKDKPGK